MTTRYLLPEDKLSLGFLALNIPFILMSWRNIPQPWSILLPVLLWSLFIIAVARLEPWILKKTPQSEAAPGNNPTGTPAALQVYLRKAGVTVFYTARLGYPLFMLLYFYMVLWQYQHVVFQHLLDPFFHRLDNAIFGNNPELVWQQSFENYWISEILHGAYFIYYGLLAVLPLYLFAKDRDRLKEYIFAAMTVFYAMALTYLLLPVPGGRFDPAVKALTEVARYGPFTRLMAYLYGNVSIFGEAFPSTHVGMSAVMVFAAFRYRLKTAVLFLVNGLLVMIATVYCGYHYPTDVIGGLL